MQRSTSRSQKTDFPRQRACRVSRGGGRVVGEASLPSRLTRNIRCPRDRRGRRDASAYRAFRPSRTRCPATRCRPPEDHQVKVEDDPVRAPSGMCALEPVDVDLPSPKRIREVVAMVRLAAGRDAEPLILQDGVAAGVRCRGLFHRALPILDRLQRRSRMTQRDLEIRSTNREPRAQDRSGAAVPCALRCCPRASRAGSLHFMTLSGVCTHGAPYARCCAGAP